MDFVHLAGSLKQETLDNLPLYIRKEPKLALLLKKIRDAGKKSFLLTNSEWYACVLIRSPVAEGSK
jgi:5'-nucleotidase